MQSPSVVDFLYTPSHPLNTKNLNKRVILDMIRFSTNGVSRADLARQMDLTRAAITTIVNDLIEADLVRETETDLDTASSGGRRPIHLEINPQHSKILGVDMAVTHLSLLLADFSAHVISDVELPFDIKNNPQECLQEVDRQARRLLERAGLTFQDIIAAAVAVPGPVVNSFGGVSAPPIMPGWDGIPIRDILSAQWNIPVVIGNDADFGALGEWAYGAGRGEQNLAYIKVGSGIGAGLLLDGHIYVGSTGCAGEIGHTTIQENGPVCSCGSQGCLEALAGGNAIAQRAKEAVRAGKRTLLSNISPSAGITARDVAEAARLGDLVAQQIITSAGSYLGIAIASLVNVFNPSLVVVGGGVAQVGDLLLNPVRQTVHERSLRPAAQALRISTAVLGRRSTGIGSVVQAINLALDQLTER